MTYGTNFENINFLRGSTFKILKNQLIFYRFGFFLYPKNKREIPKEVSDNRKKNPKRCLTITKNKIEI